MTMKKQKGFTLIELVVVIVILGILAVTAAPKFLDLQDEAKTSAVYGLAGGMRGALAMTYAQAIVEGQDKELSGTINVEGNPVALQYGYPKNADALKLVVTGLEDWKEKPTLPTGATAPSTTDADTYYGFDGFDCLVTYKAASLKQETGKPDVYIAAKANVVGDDCKRIGEQD